MQSLEKSAKYNKLIKELKPFNGQVSQAGNNKSLKTTRKFVNYLQFLLYIELFLKLSNQRKQSSPTQALKSGKEWQLSYPSLTNEIVFERLNKQVFSKGMPYSKSFFCYWLLPFMGFVNYSSSLSESLAAPLSPIPTLPSPPSGEGEGEGAASSPSLRGIGRGGEGSSLCKKLL